MLGLPAQVKIVEVGPRDGLQNEAAVVPTEVKAEYLRRLAAAGLPEIEATSFVHPRRIPQLADAEQLLADCGLSPARNQSVPNPGNPLSAVRNPRLSALVPNVRGLERALQTGISRIAVFTAASETFTRQNIGMTIAESLAVFREVAEKARAAGLTVRGYVSTCWVCPYEGEVPAEAVRQIAEALLEMGADEVSLGDTVGAAVPTEVAERLAFLETSLPQDRLALHFHDTSGTALANVFAALQRGYATFDSSAGGLGGCPYAPGAAGNLATEDLLYMLHRMGIQTGVSLEAVAEASAYLEPHLSHPLPSRQYQRLRSAQVPREEGGRMEEWKGG